MVLYSSNNSKFSGNKSNNTRESIIIKAKAILKLFNLSLFDTLEDIKPPIRKKDLQLMLILFHKFYSYLNTPY